MTVWTLTGARPTLFSRLRRVSAMISAQVTLPNCRSNRASKTWLGLPPKAMAEMRTLASRQAERALLGKGTAKVFFSQALFFD